MAQEPTPEREHRLRIIFRRGDTTLGLDAKGLAILAVLLVEGVRLFT